MQTIYFVVYCATMEHTIKWAVTKLWRENWIQLNSFFDKLMLGVTLDNTLTFSLMTSTTYLKVTFVFISLYLIIFQPLKKYNWFAFKCFYYIIIARFAASLQHHHCKVAFHYRKISQRNISNCKGRKIDHFGTTKIISSQEL